MKKLLYVIICITCILISCESKTDLSKKESQEFSLLRIQIGDKYGFINEDGKIMIEPQFDNAGYFFTEGLCFARIGNKSGLINKDGVFVTNLPDSIIWVEPFSHNISKAFVKNDDDQYYIIDNLGNYKNNGKKGYVEINVDDNKVFFIEKIGREKYNIIDEYGNSFAESWEVDFRGFNRGLCVAKKQDKWGCIDSNGTLVIDTIWDFISTFNDEATWALKDSIVYTIDKKGNIIAEWGRLGESISHSSAISCNRAIIEKHDSVWLVNPFGHFIKNIGESENINYSWDCFNTSDSLASITINHKAVKIDTLGNIVFSTDYNILGEFVDGIAYFLKHQESVDHSYSGWEGYVDINGNEVIKQSFSGYLPESYNRRFRIPSKPVYNVRALETPNGISYYNFDGELIGKDMPYSKYSLPIHPSREDFINFFDSKLSDLDPIEGIYYVTTTDYWQSREDTHSIGLNGTSASFASIVKATNKNEFYLYYADGTGSIWTKKLTRIGNSDIFAIIDFTENGNTLNGQVTINDTNHFDFKLEDGHNHYYNFFSIYEFLRDYPEQEIYKKVKEAEWYGTGFAVADGYVVTNYHVVLGAKKIAVRGIKGDMKKSYKGVIVASDKDSDLAIIRIVDKDFESLGAIPYSIGRISVEVGDNVFVLGYPDIETMGTEVKITDGIISSATGFQGNERTYQISAPVHPGNSGGPLFNEDGSVIGVINAKHSEAENVSYAVKISYLFSLINSNDLGIHIADNKLKAKKLSEKVKKVKDFVFVIECNSK